jgi:hypothetical protein
MLKGVQSNVSPRRFIAFVITILTAGFVALPASARQQLDAITDPDAYAIYGELLPQAGARVSKEMLLLQQEPAAIQKMLNCFSSAITPTDPK